MAHTSDTVRYPQGNVLLRNLHRDFPVIAHGKGLSLFDQSGNRYLDASGGALVVSVGHGCKPIAEAVGRQLEAVAYVNGTQFTSEPAEKLAQNLASRANRLGLNRCSFLSSGSEAVEAAMKFARQLWMERSQPERSVVIARTPGYHGNTLFALSASGRPHYQRLYGPLLHDVVMIPAPYRARSQSITGFADYSEKTAEVFANHLEAAILKAGPEKVAAFFVEPVIGSSAGAAVPPPGYFDRVQAICNKYGVLIIADEIMCGAGRTGKFFASEHFGLKPDLLLLGKGVSSGYVPLSVVMTKEGHVAEMAKGSGSFMHAQTFMQAPSMVAAGWATMQYYDQNKVVENARTVGAFFQQELRQKIHGFTGTGFKVGAVDGIGLFAGVELLPDGPGDMPFPRAQKFIEKWVAHAFNKGLIVWSNTGHVDGVNGDLIMLGPPLTITQDEAVEIVDLLLESLKTFR